MTDITITKGEFKDSVLMIDKYDKCLSAGFFNQTIFPIQEITEVKEVDVQSKSVFAQILFASGLCLDVKIKSKSYDLLKELLLSREDSPQKIEVPIRKVSTFNKVLAIVIGGIGLVGIIGSQLEANSNKQVIMPNEQTWRECVNHPHWAEFRKENGMVATAERRQALCGDQP